MEGVENRGRRDLANVNALKNHVRSLLSHKLKTFATFRVISFALFNFAFSPMFRESSTYYARSRAGQYTSRDGSNSVAPVQAY